MTDAKKVDRDLYLISRHIPVLDFYPINYVKEKEKVFEDKTYNPKFRYNRVFIPDKVKSTLVNMKINLRKWNRLFLDKRKKLVNHIRLRETMGTPAFLMCPKRFGEDLQENWLAKVIEY